MILRDDFNNRNQWAVGYFVFVPDHLGSLEWAGNVQPTYQELAIIVSIQYPTVKKIKRLIDPEQKQSSPLPTSVQIKYSQFYDREFFAGCQ